jgi:hypothetical protein
LRWTKKSVNRRRMSVEFMVWTSRSWVGSRPSRRTGPRR